MRIALYLNNLDEEYQISVFRGIKKQALKMGVELLCIQGETFEKNTDSGFFPSRSFIDAQGILLLSSVLLTHSSMVSMPDMDDLFPNIPVLSIGNRFLNYSSIIIKTRKSMEGLMRHLIEHHGYRKFLYIGGPFDHKDNMSREHVFRRYINSLQDKFPELEGIVENGGFDEITGMDILAKYISQHPTEPLDAVVCANDNMAIGSMKALRTQNDARWHNCAVTGFDDIPQGRLEIPSLTTIHQPLETMGRIAVKSLIDAIAKQESPKIISVESSLNIRTSCGCSNDGEISGKEKEEDLETLRKHLSHIQYQAIKSEQNLRSVSYFGQSLISIDNYKDLITALQPLLDNLENNYFGLLIYPNPTDEIPEEATILYERNQKQEHIYLGQNKTIPLKQFFGSYCYRNQETPTSRTIFHLVTGEEKLGIVVYEAKDHAHPHMCSAAVFIANAIKRLHILDDEKERSRQLEKQVKRRTRDLVEINKQLTQEANRRIAVEAEVLRISELERQRFSLDLHDDICQRLAGISMFSKSFSNEAGMKDLSAMIDETLQRTRQYAHNSFPVELDSLGLDEALQHLCSSLEQQAGCQISYLWKIDKASPFTEKESINIYRIVQEALSNVIRHSQSPRADVILSSKSGDYSISIRDYGIGIFPAKDDSQSEKPRRRRTGLGRRSMEYRAHQLNADFIIESLPGQGTLIEIRIQPGSENTDDLLEE